jgi:alditol oxidase
MRKRTFLKNTSLLLGGTALVPFGCKEPASPPVPPLKNWAGNLTFSASEYHRPTSLEEVQELVRKSKKIKTTGTRHSFSNIADSDGLMLSSDAFHEVIDLDKTGATVTVGAGMRHGELAIALQKEGYALANLASLPHISVAGAIATATHGSGDGNGNLATSVRGLELVKADGEVVRLTSQDPDFAGAVVHLGALGMVTRVTLAIEPAFQVQQEIFEHLPLTQAIYHFHDIFGGGYSVSFFTDWNPDTINQVWIKRRLEGSEPLEPLMEFYGARAATRDMHPIAELSAESCTPQMAVPGPWYERLPHFKLDFTPSNGDELQSEFFVDRAQAPEVLRLIQSMHEKIDPVLFISEVRSIRADDLWMSTAQGGDKIAFHFTWKPDGEGVMALLPELERALEPYQARPHWGKLFTLEASSISALYPRIDDFRDLVYRHDPDGKFRNVYLEKKVGV